jgi:hypothetical protein
MEWYSVTNIYDIDTPALLLCKEWMWQNITKAGW